MAFIMNINLFTQNIAEVKTTYSHHVKASDRPKISSSQTAYEICKLVFPETGYREYFYILMMDRSNNLLGVNQVSMGGISGTIADPKVIFQTALKSNACSLILAHNHPSGNTSPSEADIKLTKKLKSAGEFLDLPILDHIIVSDDSYKSFADEGLI